MASGNNIGKVYTFTDASGKKYTVNPASGGGYMDAYTQYEKDRTKQMDRRETALKKTLKQNNATTNQNYDQNARQAYVDYMRKQRALPSQLQALGVNGGATESGLLNLYSNYGSSHAANEQQRAAELSGNQSAYDEAYNTAYDAYLSDLNDRKQTAIANQIKEYDNEVTRFSSSVAQYPTTAAGYEAYQTWINNLAASSDPLKDIKIALVRQQMASQFPNGSPSSGGGGGGYSRGGGYYGGYSGGGGGSDDSSSGNDRPRYTTTTEAVDRYYKSGAIKPKYGGGSSNNNSGGLLSRLRRYW